MQKNAKNAKKCNFPILALYSLPRSIYPLHWISMKHVCFAGHRGLDYVRNWNFWNLRKNDSFFKENHFPLCMGIPRAQYFSLHGEPSPCITRETKRYYRSLLFNSDLYYCFQVISQWNVHITGRESTIFRYFQHENSHDKTSVKQGGLNQPSLGPWSALVGPFKQYWGGVQLESGLGRKEIAVDAIRACS